MDSSLAKTTGGHKGIHKNKTHSANTSQSTSTSFSPATATLDRIPTETWGPFTICVVVFLVILTCLILNCSRIRRKVDERRMTRHGKSGPFSYEKRHKELQEADLEWNVHPPIVFTNEKLSTPESTYNSKRSSGSDWSSNSSNSTIAQKHHYQDREFIKNQPPGVQLRLTLENASVSSVTKNIPLPKKTSQQLVKLNSK